MLLKKVTCQGMGRSVDNFLEETIPKCSLEGKERVQQEEEGWVGLSTEKEGRELGEVMFQ